MKILHLSINDIRNDTRTIKQIYSAEKNGHSVKAICFKLKKKIKKTKLIDYKKIKLVKPIYYNLFFINKFLYKIYTLLYSNFMFVKFGIKINPDLIHCSDYHPLFSATIIKLFCGSKIIYDAHELESQTTNLNKIYSKMVYFYEKLHWPFIDGFITVSPSILKWYKKFFKKKNSILTVNSPLILKHSKKNDYLKNKYKIKKNKKLFLYIGKLGNNRGIDLILKSFSSNSIKSHVVFMGHGFNKMKILKKYEKKNNNIHFHSAVSAEQMDSIIASADYGFCLIDPNSSLSDKYCLPNKFFEYVFSGIPVISSNLKDVVALLKKYNLGTFIEYNSTSLINQIKLLDKKKINFSKKNLSRINYLNWKNQSNNMLNLYNKLYKS